MAVLAITPINHGEADGSVKTFNVGDDVSGLGEDAVKQLVAAGSAIDTSEKNPLGVAAAEAPADEDTRKRDELIAKYMFGNTAVKDAEEPGDLLPDSMTAGVPEPVADDKSKK